LKSKLEDLLRSGGEFPGFLDYFMADQRLTQTRDNVFFIVGSGRCGSTVLRAIFDAHSMTAVPSETGWYHGFEQAERKAFEQQADKRKYGIAMIYNSEQISTIITNREAFEALVPESPSWDDLFVAVLTAYRESRGRNRVGEKTPSHISHMVRLAKIYPNAKFIHIIRDPRAVVSSYVKAPHYINGNGKNPIRAIQKWTNALERHREAQKTLAPERYTTVTYESLVTDPRPELDRLCAFLDLPFEEEMLEFSKRAEMGFVHDTNNRAGLQQALHAGSVDKWKKAFTPQEIELVEELCKAGMEEFGYQPIADPAAKSHAGEIRRLEISADFRDFARVMRRKFVRRPVKVAP